MSVFAQAPFNLQQGGQIVTVGSAMNGIGWGQLSQPSPLGVAVETVPGQPTSAPILVSQGPAQITVSMASVTGSLTGGSPVTSYNLQFN